MRAFVTGAMGFLGGHLRQGLLRHGCDVVGLVRDRSHHFGLSWDRRVTYVFGDVTDLPLLERALAEYEIDTVFHLAAQAQVAVGAADPTGTIRTNVLGTLNVLEACRRQKVRRLVCASTDKVYGSTENPYTEKTHLAERTPYGASKACADILAQTYANTYGMSVGITRCGNLYGPAHLNWSTLIPGTIRRLLRGERPVVRFGGRATRDFLHVDDAVSAYLTLAKSDKVGAFNFSGENPQRIIDVVRAIIDVLGIEIEPDVREEGVGEIEAQWLDCTRARRELGWSIKVSFKEGLRSTVAWYREFLGGRSAVA